jgi:UDP-2-acetamido-3-amino-2,3-dideoxy-glucuronate N-acetyltransferase
VGIYVPPLVWASQFQYDPDAVLLVLASHPYDPDDYVRDYGEFLDLVGSGE